MNKWSVWSVVHGRTPNWHYTPEPAVAEADWLNRLLKLKPREVSEFIPMEWAEVKSGQAQ